MQVFPRVRGNCSPLEIELTNFETGAVIDCSLYTWRIAAKDSLVETDEYVISPQSGTGTSQGLVTFDLAESEWLKLQSGKNYTLEIEGHTTGLTGKPVIKEQIIMAIGPRVITT